MKYFGEQKNEIFAKQFIAKFSNENEMMRSFFHSIRTYEREISIYKYLHQNFPVSLARCHFCGLNMESGENFILLEDLKEKRNMHTGDSVIKFKINLI